jgi:hypothetical protein
MGLFKQIATAAVALAETPSGAEPARRAIREEKHRLTRVRHVDCILNLISVEIMALNLSEAAAQIDKAEKALALIVPPASKDVMQLRLDCRRATLSVAQDLPFDALESYRRIAAIRPCGQRGFPQKHQHDSKLKNGSRPWTETSSTTRRGLCSHRSCRLSAGVPAALRSTIGRSWRASSGSPGPARPGATRPSALATGTPGGAGSHDGATPGSMRKSWRRSLLAAPGIGRSR